MSGWGSEGLFELQLPCKGESAGGFACKCPGFVQKPLTARINESDKAKRFPKSDTALTAILASALAEPLR